VNKQHLPKLILLPFVLIALSACGGSNTKYRDTSALEQPPHLDIVVNKSDATSVEEVEKKGLTNLVLFSSDEELILKLPFDKAWWLLEKACDISDIEITDRNREKGQYYVVFDPDTAEHKKNENQNLLMAFFTQDKYPKGRYLLTISPNEQGVKVKGEFLEYLNEHSSQDGYAETAPSDNGLTKLLNKLYSTLHDDLPAN
jgi:uncharacterized lipoprotein